MKHQFVRDHVFGMARWTDQAVRRFLRNCTPRDLLALDADFESWADDGQIAPSSEGWRVWLMMAGRGYGKTRAGAEWIHRLGMGRNKRIALVAATIDEARSIMIEGVSGLRGIAEREQVKVIWEPSLNRFRWPSGSIATLYSADNPDSLRGPEHEFAWCDELAKWRCGEEAWDILQIGMRIGRRPRTLVTTTPRPSPLLEAIRADPYAIVTRGRTWDNITLEDHYLEAMVRTYGQSRLARQELYGELFAEADGSLFPRALSHPKASA